MLGRPRLFAGPVWRPFPDLLRSGGLVCWDGLAAVPGPLWSHRLFQRAGLAAVPRAFDGWPRSLDVVFSEAVFAGGFPDGGLLRSSLIRRGFPLLRRRNFRLARAGFSQGFSGDSSGGACRWRFWPAKRGDRLPLALAKDQIQPLALENFLKLRTCAADF